MKNIGSWKSLERRVTSFLMTNGTLTVLHVRFEIQKRAEPIEVRASMESPADQWIPREGEIPLRHVDQDFRYQMLRIYRLYIEQHRGRYVNLYFDRSLRLSKISAITLTYAPAGKRSTESPRGGNSEGREVTWLVFSMSPGALAPPKFIGRSRRALVSDPR